MARIAKNECRCGCGTTVKRKFAPGHDQKLVSAVARAIATGQADRRSAIRHIRRISPALATRVRSVAGNLIQ